MGEGEAVALVTGATGFVGGHLARALLARGYDVRALARDPARPSAAALERAGCRIAPGDVTDRDALVRAAQGCTHLFHVAGVFRTAQHPDSYYRKVNTEAVRNVMAAVRANGVGRVVHTSTIGVHGDVAEIPAHEETAFNPGDVYQRTKLGGEMVAREAIGEGLPVAIVRPTGMYGPGDLRFLKLFRTVNSGAFRMFGSGEILFHMTYIDDVVAGMILAGEHPDAVGEVFVIASDEYCTLNELVRRLADTLGARPPRGRLPLAPLLAAATVCEWTCRPLGIDPPLHRRRVHFFTKARAFSNEKARRVLGFRPAVGLEEGLRRTAEWYRAEGHLPAPRRAA